MAQQVSGACQTLLTQHPGTHQRLADHFWCDVLAALAKVLTDALGAANQASNHVSQLTVNLIAAQTWNTVHAQRTESTGNSPNQHAKTRKHTTRADDDKAAGLTDAILEKAVHNLVKTLMAGITAATHQILAPWILRLRLLAILFCPDPYAHKAVWNHCVVPLVTQGIIFRVTNQLTQFQQFFNMFKQTWKWPA